MRDVRVIDGCWLLVFVLVLFGGFSPSCFVVGFFWLLWGYFWLLLLCCVVFCCIEYFVCLVVWFVLMVIG